jgi:hypothetical protein
MVAGPAVRARASQCEVADLLYPAFKNMNLYSHLLREAGKLASSQTFRRVEISAGIGRLEGRRVLTEADELQLEDLRTELESCSQALPRLARY